MKRLLLLFAVLASLPAISASVAKADTIQFFNTAVANDGSLLASGTADSHYSLLYSADPNGTIATATTAHPYWEQDTGTAGWISPGSDGTQGWSSGYYVYETLLDLTGYDPATASLSGLIAADNEVYIYLNQGGSALYSGGGFSSGAPFLINSGFISGINQVEFVVHNDGGPTGLMVDDTVATANAQTPEPGSLFLLAGGTALGGYALRNGRLRSRQEPRRS